MRNIIFLFLIYLVYSNNLFAQTLKGRIVSQTGDPIKYSTVYIPELRMGTTSNTDGYYEIKLTSGEYDIVYQSLGYQPVYSNVTLSDKTIIKNIVLPPQIYQIPEVIINASDEDPAYSIMRRAIGMAPYYLNSISYYKADVYLKGELLINKLPGIKSSSVELTDQGFEFSLGGKKNKSSKSIKPGDSFFMESFNEIEFEAPDKYNQKVISINSTFPKEGNDISPLDYISASFYQPVLVDFAISPLSPEAFAHYRFRYLGATSQGMFTVNKIEVIPKRKSQQLFSGIIYIIDDLWCLHSIDLTNKNLIGKVRIQQQYIPVQNETWMPVSHKFDINIKILGIKATVGYLSSVKYKDVSPNTTLKKPVSLPDYYNTGNNTQQEVSEQTNREKKIAKILDKDEMNNRDMVRLSRLMEKESENSIPDSVTNDLEITDKTTYAIEKDATKKDSIYWANVRPVPLSDINLVSLRARDSINKSLLVTKSSNDIIEHKQKTVSNKSHHNTRKIVMGGSWQDTTGFKFTTSGIIDASKISFNTVDGFVYGTDFRISKRWKNNNRLYFSPELNWAFSRKELMWRINTRFYFSGNTKSQLFMRGGIMSNDIGTGGSINRFLNTSYSLLLKENYLKLYESEYFTFGYKSEITNGLSIEFQGNFDNRKMLSNTTDFSIFNTSKKYSDNIPVNEYLMPLSNHVNQIGVQKHLDFVTHITFTPFQKYKMSNGRRIPMGSDWPKFILMWEHGLNKSNETGNQFKNYDMIRLEASRSTTVGSLSNLRWLFRTGGFLDNTNISFYDFFHFNSQPITLLINNYTDAFMLAPYYSLSTPEAFYEAHLKYTTPYLLLKLLPGISNTLMKENLCLSFIDSRFRNSYTEIGYSISEILFAGELAIFAGFDDLKYETIGAKIILRIK